MELMDIEPSSDDFMELMEIEHSNDDFLIVETTPENPLPKTTYLTPTKNSNNSRNNKVFKPPHPPTPKLIQTPQSPPRSPTSTFPGFVCKMKQNLPDEHPITPRKFFKNATLEDVELNSLLSDLFDVDLPPPTHASWFLGGISPTPNSNSPFINHMGDKNGIWYGKRYLPHPKLVLTKLPTNFSTTIPTCSSPLKSPEINNPLQMLQYNPKQDIENRIRKCIYYNENGKINDSKNQSATRPQIHQT
ncbi:unnamed protein product [Allacma fusca]|uniref:Uncharacterized protein n=1 Tax=Allacma fusca TaxID=39272 RepID=A0A8J2NHS7_9HEXA|nr:unnamed protein product [Allacma fusca]